jgi:hypothetical protein
MIYSAKRYRKKGKWEIIQKQMKTIKYDMNNADSVFMIDNVQVNNISRPLASTNMKSKQESIL